MKINVEKGSVTFDNAGEMLEALDTFLSRDDSESQRVWNILGAVRGPDEENILGTLKEQTTAKIRTAAFPKTVGERDGTSYHNGSLFRPGVVDPKLLDEDSNAFPSGHFADHVRYAVESLQELGRTI